MNATPFTQKQTLPVRSRVRDVGQARALMKSIQLEFEPQAELRLALEELRQTAVASRGRPQTAICALAESYSGKSRGLQMFAEEVNRSADVPAGEIPIPIVNVDPDGSLGSVASDILRALGEPRPDRGKPPYKWERARDRIRARGVQVLAFDEFQRANRRPTLSAVIAYKIQDILDSGDCAAAFIGKKNAGNIFKQCPDLRNRLEAPVEMPPLSWANADDRAIFTKFVDDYDAELVRLGITRCKSGLKLDNMPQLLMEASRGLIGCFCRLIEVAAQAVVRDNRDAITYDDLEQATEDWAVGNERGSHNPFTKVGA